MNKMQTEYLRKGLKKLQKHEKRENLEVFLVKYGTESLIELISKMFVFSSLFRMRVILVKIETLRVT